MQTVIHYGLHFGLPLAIALFFFKNNWKKVYVIMLLTFVIDLDHLLADPIFDPNRCSVGFHPLHSYFAVVIYFGLLFFKPLRVVALGLIIHIIADTIDCLLM